MNQLPKLEENQLWCCSNGCGACRAVPATHEYFRSEDRQGNLIESKSENIFVSHCCRKDLMLWDEGKQDFVDWDYDAALSEQQGDEKPWPN